MDTLNFLKVVGDNQNGDMPWDNVASTALAVFTPSSTTVGGKAIYKGVSKLFEEAPVESSSALKSDKSLFKAVKENPGTTAVVATAVLSGCVLLYKWWEKKQDETERNEKQVREALAEEW